MTPENPYVKQFPDLLQGKTLLYCHGFASSGQSGTVARLRTVFPNTRILAPDLPVHPAEAMTLLRTLCRQEQPDVILGTSMGGMYCEQLYGYDRICVNPALEMGETMRQHGMTGTQQFQNPRQDGIQEFYVDKQLIKEYKEQSEQRFTPPASEGAISTSSESTSPFSKQVWGLFGDHDTTVDTYDLFRAHYPQAIRFHGEHRMDDRSFMHSVVPVLRWIDDAQEHRQRPIVYIGVETLADAYQHPASSMQKAVRLLIERYQVYFVADDSSPHADVQQWLYDHVNVPAWHHVVFTERRDLLYGDYLIAKVQEADAMATFLHFGSDQFKSWDDLIDYFLLLGGQ